VINFGVGIPTGTEGLMYPVPFISGVGDIVSIAKKAEKLGYESVWGNDHIVTQKYVSETFRDPPKYYSVLLTLAAIASQTTTLVLGAALIVLPIRHPGLLAKDLVTLDYLSGGRIKIGVGIGAYREEFDSLLGSGAVGKNRGEMMDESLIVMERLFQEDRVTHLGQYFELRDMGSYPKPRDKPFPFYIGGNSKKSLERTVNHGVGWLPSGFTPEEIAQRVKQLEIMLSERGRGIRDIDIAPQFSVSLGKTHSRAVEKYKASQQYTHMLSLASSTMKGLDLSDVERRDLIGTSEEVRERIGQYLEAGAKSFPALLFTANNIEEYYEVMQWFAEEVMNPLNIHRQR
jgi:probable F420-dependent oxidoreductase